MMAVAPVATKKTKSLHRWRVSLITEMPAKFLGYVEARDQIAAIEVAVRKYRISDTLRHKIVIRREEYRPRHRDHSG
jgi:hypothetical protein